MAGTRDLEALLRRLGGEFVRVSAKGHKRWKLGKVMVTVPVAHSFKGRAGKRVYDNVEAYIRRVAREQGLREHKV